MALAGTIAECLLDDLKPALSRSSGGLLAKKCGSSDDAVLAAGYADADVFRCFYLVRYLRPEITLAADARVSGL